jgi:hypothetical protein
MKMDAGKMRAWGLAVEGRLIRTHCYIGSKLSEGLHLALPKPGCYLTASLSPSPLAGQVLEQTHA